jgi:hypothetical protein
MKALPAFVGNPWRVSRGFDDALFLVLRSGKKQGKVNGSRDPFTFP